MQTPDSSAPPTAAASSGGATHSAPRTRPIEENPVQAVRAVELLRTPSALEPLTPEDARQVVAFMRLVTFPAGTVLFREGDKVGTSYMLLILEGEVTIDVGAQPGDESVTISALGPGSILGEMSLLDNAPRSAQCTAISPVVAAGLSRGGLERLVEEHPKVAARLLIAVAQRLADRVRSLSQQLQIYAQIGGR